ncbi:hypothetical protein OUZ56_009629 [Daphnia magna]|uniref:Calmodulin-lysine N-methyltransferase n=1 Tax=Daphnia magna TaxID=35525 RepID=A0ABR0AGJ7_9CRUS|nr:hypothetical protein OUZ56_009629 [Daphnia magna]
MDDGEEKSLCPEGNQLIARTRWKLLAKVLQKTGAENGQSSSQLAPTTSRQLYGLFEWDVLESNLFWQDNCGQWLQCCSFNYPHFSLNVRFLINQFSIDELTGFNNTGNVCVWPSEEVLAYYCMKKNYVFKQKTVLELGGGMTCLASFAVAKTSDAMLVACTDGKPASVENVKRIIEHNNLSSTCPITAQYVFLAIAIKY